MNQFNIAKYVLFASAMIGLVLFIVTGHHFFNSNLSDHSAVAQHQEKENTEHQIDQHPLASKTKEEPATVQTSHKAATSVAIKSPHRSTGGDHSVAIWKSRTPDYPFEKRVPGKTVSSQKNNHSPFFVAKKTSVTGVSLQPADDWGNEDSEMNLNESDDEQSDEWESLPDQITPQKRPAKVVQSTLPTTETEQQLNSISQQLGTLANESELQYQRKIRKSARDVQNLHRNIRINNLQSELQEMKWSQPPREPKSPFLSRQYLGQRYFYIARDQPQSKTSQPLKFHHPDTADEIIKKWSPHQAEDLR